MIIGLCALFILFIFALTFVREFPLISFLLVIGGIAIAYYSKKNAKQKLEKRILEFEELFSKESIIQWSDFFNMDYAGAFEIEEFIKTGIAKGLFHGKLEHNAFVEPYVELITEETLLFLDQLAIDKDMDQYNFVDVNRSSNEVIKSGTYVYKFTDNNAIALLKAPFNIVKSTESNMYPVFNSDLLTDNFLIDIDKIRDFQVFGNQMLQTSIDLTGKDPGVGTVFSEIFLGPSYSILKGINKISLETTHTINDARVVQVIFEDQTDIEFGGINIFYDFNRRLGNVKNKELANNNLDNLSNTENISLENNNYSAELRELKALLDEDIITLEEFDKKKKLLLNI